MDVLNSIKPLRSWHWWASWAMILLGCMIMGSGFVLFINPYKFVPGGVYGLSIVLHNIFPALQVGTIAYFFEVPLLLAGFYIFGRQFGIRTIVAAMFTPFFMNMLTLAVYPTPEAVETLDPALLLGGNLDMSGDLLLACLFGAVMIGVGQGIVVRNQATTGGTDIVAMLLQKYAGIKFSSGILIADGVVVTMGLIVIGFGIGLEGESAGWVLTLYSLLIIYTISRVVAYMLDGASYDKLIFIITAHSHDELRRFIIDDMDRSATYIKARGMYTQAEKEMIFLVVSRNEVAGVQRKIKQIDPRAFVVVTDAYDTFGEGFKPLPDGDQLQAS